MSTVNGTRDEGALAKAAETLSKLHQSGMTLTDKSRVKITELPTALRLQGMLSLAESIVSAED